MHIGLKDWCLPRRLTEHTSSDSTLLIPEFEESYAPKLTAPRVKRASSAEECVS